ncbi:hypothetical protein [Phenylobacterium immobile]|uniref:hypothetical protein n=1 Tax=Phenylobacterium immobile TaxID=21 RepID=UPI000A43FD3F|nr:hypothetical protein [Phenylobacterium immobile]
MRSSNLVKSCLILTVFAGAGCATAPEPVVRTVEVKVPVSRSCIPTTLRQEPTFPDTDAALRATAGPDDLIKLLAAGRLLRDQWLAEVRPVLRGCR